MALHDSLRQHPGVFNAQQLGQGACTVGQVRQLLVVRGNVLPNHLLGGRMVMSGHKVGQQEGWICAPTLLAPGQQA